MVDLLTYVLGIDIGGTKIAAALLTNAGKMIARTEVPSDPTDRERMYSQVVFCVEQLFERTTVEASDIDAIGVGVPGKVDHEQGVAVFQNNLPWAEFPIADRLKETFSLSNVIVENDVIMATFAEWAEVKEHDEETFVYMTVSTGISCQTIHQGEIIRGAGFSGEVGLLPVLTKQERLEQVSSGPALQRKARLIGHGSEMSPEEIFKKFTEGDQEAIELIEEMVAGIAEGLYAIVALLDPNKIVIGGGVFNHQPFLLEEVKKALKPYLIETQEDVLNRFSGSALKGDAGVIGAGIRANMHIATMAH